MGDEQRWMRAIRAADVALPRRVVSLELEGESFIVVNDGGTLRAFYNVCQHRGMRLCPLGAGSFGRLRCRYHGWTYGLDGSLQHVPERESFDDLEPDRLGLEPVACELRDGFVWLRASQREGG